ncbi:hypothetical protein [Leucobacter ruminantium]|uniref:Uncharacterized protein n=1 Tax=Leucobacter ruminantium TaxID=1289170 RepID=A0A939LZF4_9MICO|nr:hypothetical protein [Leucobacter ruminantium]MBO1804285.1 hypothetical protein [Leucobacter ruminantium]
MQQTHQDGWRLLNKGDSKGLSSEQDVQLFFGLLLQKSRFDVNREPNNGRGPVDFKISEGLDKSLIEFKLAKSSSLKRNMENQVEVYKKANGTNSAVFVVIAYTASEIQKTKETVLDLGLNKPDSMEVVIIDASPKPRLRRSGKAVEPSPTRSNPPGLRPPHSGLGRMWYIADALLYRFADPLPPHLGGRQ